MTLSPSWPWIPRYFMRVIADLRGERAASKQGQALAEKFRLGEVRCALISVSGATGISLAPRDGRSCVHYVLEHHRVPRSLEQQSGRLHRIYADNNVDHVIPTLGAAVDHKVISCTVRKLRNLGALTQSNWDAPLVASLSRTGSEDAQCLSSGTLRPLREATRTHRALHGGLPPWRVQGEEREHDHHLSDPYPYAYRGCAQRRDPTEPSSLRPCGPTQASSAYGSNGVH